MLFDTHCHINDAEFNARLDTVLQNAVVHGLGRIVVPAFDHASCERAVELAQTVPGCYAAVGFHPHDAVAVTEQSYERLALLVQQAGVVAVGEIGLDFHYDDPPDVQEAVFRRQIRLAKECGLPIVIHDREAHGMIVSILKEERAGDIGGVMHCFSGSWEMAQQCMEMNFYISLGGPVTFKNAKRPQEIAQRVPLDRLLIETDAPWLAPHPHRGQQNEPAYVRLVAEKVSELRGLPLEEVERLTWENACRLFRLPVDPVEHTVLAQGTER